MLILSEFDIQFRLPAPTAIVAVLSVHPSLEQRVRAGNKLAVEHFTTSIADAPAFTDGPKVNVACTDFIDSFGNRCARFFAPKGHLRLSGSSVVETDTNPDPNDERVEQASVQNLPADVLQFLLPSRYCQVDQFGGIAQDLFGSMAPGWARAVAIRDWVHARVAFNYNAARPTKTSMDVFTERVGVCRDFQHLATTLSRCMNIPARYATGYVGDIRRPFSGPGDFSAWYQVFLGGKWINIDARHSYPRIGRVLMATGRDAADVAITTSFGAAYLAHFYVESNEVDADGNRVPLPEALEMPQQVPALLKAPTQTNGSEASPTQTQSATL